MKTITKNKVVNELIKRHELNEKFRGKIKCYQRYFIYNYLRGQGKTYQEIGDLFNRNHDAIIHGIKVYDDMIYSRDKEFEKAVKNLSIELKLEHIFNNPLLKEIQEALMASDCEQSKKVLGSIYKSMTGIEYKRKYKKIKKSN